MNYLFKSLFSNPIPPPPPTPLPNDIVNAKLQAMANYQQAANGLYQAGTQQFGLQNAGMGSGLSYNPYAYSYTTSYTTGIYPSPIAVSMPPPGPAVAILPEETMIAALVGWRRWTVGMFDDTLRSNNGTSWVPYEPLRAACPQGSSCRGVNCSCGIYAYKTREQALALDNPRQETMHLMGAVWLWGRVIECEQGYRAQYAYPKAFLPTGGIAHKIASLYGVKLVLQDKAA